MTRHTTTRKVTAAVIHPVSNANCHGATNAVATEIAVPHTVMNAKRSSDGAPKR
jgi:hypothetical protein